MPGTTPPKQPYDDSAAQKWRCEHPEQDKILRKWEAAGLKIKCLAEVASLWIERFTVRETTKRREQELARLLRKVETSCRELAEFLKSTYGEQTEKAVVHYDREARKASLHSRQMVTSGVFNVDRFGRSADLRPLIAVQEEIRFRTGKRPGEAQLRALLDLTAHAYGIKNFEYNPESLRKSLDYFRNNRLNREFLQSLASSPLRKATTEPASPPEIS